MKMTAAQRKRLAALLSQSSLDTAETTELDNLKAIALEDKLDLDTIKAEHKSATDDEPMTPEQLTALVEGVVTKALTEAGMDSVALVASITKSLKTDDGKELAKQEDIEVAVKKALVGSALSPDALVLAIKAALPTPAAGVTQAQLDAALLAFGKSFRQPAEHQFAVSPVAPIAHRNGNLTVAAKQLLNLCLMNANPEALASCNSTRPAHMNDGIAADQLAKAIAWGEAGIKRVREAAIYGKTFTTAGAGAGLELMPADLSSDIQMRFYMESVLANMLTANEIQMPTNPFTIPLITTRPRFRKGVENGASDPRSSEPGTDDMTLNAKKLIGISDYTYEADEDGIVAMLPILLEGLGNGASESFEDALINGDTTGTHMDLDITDADDRAKLFKGLRKLALAGSCVSSWATGGVIVSNIKKMRKLMFRFGLNPKDLLLICGTQGYNDIVGLDETLTYDKVGSSEAARILTGVAGSIFGIKLVPSAMCREDLDVTGMYNSGASTVKGSMLLIHRPSWYVGVRRGFTVETDSDKKKQTNSVIASFRRDFIPKETPAATTMPLVYLGYNYDA